MFQPSRASYGDLYGSTEEEKKDPAKTIEGYVPAIREFFFGTTARRDLAKAQAQLDNLYREAEGKPQWAQRYYVNEINKKIGEIEALEEEAAEEKRKSAGVFAVLAVVTVAGGTLALSLGLGAYHNLKEAQLTQRKIEKLGN